MIIHPKPSKQYNPRKNLGLIHVYTGEGKGKSTAALGLAARALGHGHKVLVVQFLKADKDLGEYKFYQDIPNIEIIQFGNPDLINPENPSDMDIYLASKAMEYLREQMIRNRPDLLILDEVNPAAHYKALELDDLISFLENKHQETEVVLTGRKAPQELIDLAHLVTDMGLAKHYYHRKNPARHGIEF